jgi:hypothetical protein
LEAGKGLINAKIGSVWMQTGRCLPWVLVLLAAGASTALAGTPEYRRAKQKVQLIESEQAAPGSTIVFTPGEINDWARFTVPTYVPKGFSGLSISLGDGTATGRAMIDFARVRHADDADLSVVEKLIAGERPVLVSVSVKSANGICNVDLNRLQISNVSATGYVLELLIKAFVLPMFPEVKVGEPFELRHRIEQITIKPSGLYVKIKR